VNTYDFDKTIFNPDSSHKFCMYCLRRYPAAVLPSLPGTAIKGLSWFLKRISTKELKQQVFSFLRRIPDVDTAVNDFWRENRQRVENWYLEQKREDDVIISASPEFLLAPICEELGVTLIGTRMDKHSGKIEGANCHDKEKVLRFRAIYPDAHVDEFYSDSLSDTPMAEIADRAFLVDMDKRSPWPFEK